ncbi:hypothetical protein [Streptomyces vilmorinianum]|uniref:hypothetical protein n=1 Tax=Streptomyces vilmorinianum TaxID=3051092 RepID=UPI0010FAE6BF|nr:hypothetical protein [Streptomyces vilmorinianum]
MGIESDQLVFDYLSRVGDLAQQRQLSSSARMRLVSGLRGEIDRRRATYGQESPTVVRGILEQLGTPDEVVDRAAGIPPVPAPAGLERPEVPRQRGRSRKKRAVPKPRTEPQPRPQPEPSPGPDAWATAPHLAGTDEVGVADTEPDWWRLDDTPRPGDDLVPGFKGGVEIPELLKPPVEETDEADEPVEEDEAPRRGWKRLLRRPRKASVPAADPDPDADEDVDAAPATEAARRVRLGNPVLLLAALLLVGGAVFGSLLALAGGWLLAYASRRLSRVETQWAVVVLPALAATAGAVWIWGRIGRRWGAPIAEGGEAMGAAISETWPWTLRSAAVASALFLIWRARRH